MYVVLLATGAVFGLTAGVYLGLPAFALGLMLGLATQVIMDALADLPTAVLVGRAAGLAAMLQLTYGLGLLLRRLRPQANAPSE
ncbi:hypothetical protein [Salinarimonas sp.]|uniref:hypothetical protein n=1 Tax=Salinarimonas sp. TaxID=2766526 RepID=UPI0032D9901E